MTLNVNRNAVDNIRRAIATDLLTAAVYFENEMRQRVARPNPPPYLTPSKPGEYPKLRTGAGQKALTHEPTDIAEVMKTLEVRVGYRKDNPHLLYLELGMDRLGLKKTLEDLKPKLARLATASFNG